jgi:5-formyltetrahydrofolate cyclo-ligase
MAVPPPLPTADKRTLRATLRRARAAFAESADAHALTARLLPLLDRGATIAGYVACRGEPDIMPVLRRAHECGLTVSLPHVGADRHMHFAAWHPGMALTSGALGIPQPEAAEDEIVADIVLTPLVGFDRGGHRLGQGAGYYDRWFAAHPDAMRIGIAWSVQEVSAIPQDDWDAPLDAIATELEWIRP